MTRSQPPTDPRAALDRWLAAEGAGPDDNAGAAADAALAELLVELPRPAPPPGFADGVLVRVREAPRHRRLGRSAVPGRGVRRWTALVPAAVFAAAALAAAGVLLAPRPMPLLGAPRAAAVVQAGVDVVVAAGQGLADLSELANELLLLARAVAEPLATPPVAILAAACLLVSLLAMRCLYDLIQRDRRWVHADPI